MAAGIRVIAGRKSVQPKLGEALKSRNHSLDHLFSSKALMLEEKKKKKKKDDLSDSEDEEDRVEEGDNCYVERVGVSHVLSHMFS